MRGKVSIASLAGGACGHTNAPILGRQVHAHQQHGRDKVHAHRVSQQHHDLVVVSTARILAEQLHDTIRMPSATRQRSNSSSIRRTRITCCKKLRNDVRIMMLTSTNATCCDQNGTSISTVKTRSNNEMAFVTGSILTCRCSRMLMVAWIELDQHSFIERRSVRLCMSLETHHK